MVAGSGSARGRRGPRARSGARLARTLSGTVQLLERDEVAVGVAHHEPARAPLGRFGLDHDVRALGQGAEALVDVVDVEVHIGARRRIAGGARFRHALGEDHFEAVLGVPRAAAVAVSAPIVGDRPAEHVAIEREGGLEMRGADEQVVKAVAHAVRPADCFSCSCASSTASAVMLMMRRTVAVGVRMCTGLAAPSRIGPTVMPAPPTTFSRLNEMLAASSVGMMRRLASPLRREFGKALERTSSESAASPCISPSTSSAGIFSRIIASAVRILRAEGASLVPKLEWETSATFGARPKRRISSAASIVISTICSGVGFTFTQ